MIILLIAILIIGLVLVVKGADWLVDGASDIARKFKVSEFVIGLTIVGFGTSCPELVVSLTGALQGSSDIAAGNVIGSNIMNTLLILGVTALISPIAITAQNKKRDIPITAVVSVIFIALGMNKSLIGIGQGDNISRPESAIFLILFAAYLYMCFKWDSAVDDSDSPAAANKLGRAILLCIGGLAGLIFGGRLFVDSAVQIATRIGVSDKFIAITILAGGTSLPELVTCAVAAAKNKGQLALGNILGSNIFNILLIIGCAALVRPISMAGMNWTDMLTLLGSVLLLLVFGIIGKGSKISRVEGLVLLIGYALYIAHLIITI